MNAPHADTTAFLLRLGRAFHGMGYPSHRLEEMLSDAAEAMGVEAQFFATPTSIFAAFGSGEGQRTFLSRVEPGELHLERLRRVQQIARAVMRGERTPAEGVAALEALDREPARWHPVLSALALGAAAAAAARFLGGGAVEVPLAGALAMLIGALAGMDLLSPAARRVFEPLAAFLVALVVHGLGTRMTFSTYPAMLGALMVLLPGLAFSAAMSELNSQHLVSGTARLTGAIVRFLGIAFGVALGTRIAELLWGVAPYLDPVALPGWTENVALFVAPLGFTVLMRARPSDAPTILGVCVLAFMGGRWGAATLGPELGVFVGAFVAAALSHLLARRLDQPPLVTLTPALLLLVPGSIGFRSLALLMESKVLGGIEAAFRMVIMFAALVAGLQVAGVAVPAPRLGSLRRR